MSRIKNLLTRVKKHLSRNKRRAEGMAGVVYGVQPPVGIRKENGVFLAIRRGIAKSAPRKKSKKLQKRSKRSKS